MTSISAASPADAISNIVPAAAVPPTLTPAARGDLAQTALNLASESSVVALLGAGGTDSAVYTASGLLNSLIQAGTAASAVASTPTAPQAMDQGLVDLLSAPPAASSMYSAAGGLLSSAADTIDLATILKSTPGVASTLTHDSFDQGIVGTISTLA